MLSWLREKPAQFDYSRARTQLLPTKARQLNQSTPNEKQAAKLTT
jgi:hypothetical protein